MLDELRNIREFPGSATHVIQFHLAGSPTVILQFVNAFDEYWLEVLRDQIESFKDVHIKDNVKGAVLDGITGILVDEIAQTLADPFEAGGSVKLIRYGLDRRDGDQIVVANHVASAEVVDVYVRSPRQ